ncbi:multidrug resistance-associated protein 1 [Aplysia californica]|uniref:Multidrug resistance-associated protein 1 n=1 Tax=Aplysia californica TaxID=6500 RepID=A0ABM1VRM1_APLCA|nr:multidrug resistance-associated protein 1 [Aplysia californica]
MFVVNTVCFIKFKTYTHQLMQVKDERLKVLSEVLNGIKVIKLYGWEPMFAEKVAEIRNRELKILLKLSFIDIVETFSWTVSIFWMLYFILMTFVLVDSSHHLDANSSFVTLNFINLLRLATNVLPVLIQASAKVVTSVKRLNKYLNSEDISRQSLYRNTDDELPVRISEADFSWEKNGPLSLKSISLQVSPGQLVAVVGTVGSGKSSLISALLGEMHNVRGSFNLNSSVALVPQQAWIQNATLRDNILFGRSHDPDFYDRVVSACALLPDLDMMPAGDLSEIGEKGINLSGGQKQRVSLARALYSDADIYLLDDPLSAVDSHVGRHIFDQVIGHTGMLGHKTRVLVTHGIHWLTEVDTIAVMDDGHLTGVATLDEWVERGGAFAQFLSQHLHNDRGGDEEEEEGEDESIMEDGHISKAVFQRLVSITSEKSADDSAGETLHKSVHKQEAGSDVTLHVEKSGQKKEEPSKSKLITEEEMDTGKIKWSVYGEVAKAYGIGFTILTVVFFIANEVALDLGDLWLSAWTDDQPLSNFTQLPASSEARADKNEYYLLVYTGLGLAQTVLVIAYSIVLQCCKIKSCRKFHANLLHSVLRAPMEFFDTTPMGRILNRFGTDMEQLDMEVFFELRIVLAHILRSVGIIVIISYSVPVFLAVIVPLLGLFYLAQQFYIRTSCQLRRITSKNRSPLYAHFSETLSGTNVIRAYQAQGRFIHESEAKTDYFQRAVYASNAVNKWMQVRMDMLSYVIIGSSVIFAVSSRDEMSAGLVGLTITYALSDPMLFAGSLRLNLDPFQEKTDAELWTALEHAHLKAFVEESPQGLEHEVGEGGQNLSVGQRQLVCLARTLLRKTKILILDEATAAVDVQTDGFIQRTIREEFSNCTILTIAHRLNTIIDYDRVLVLDMGQIAESGPPAELLADPTSVFFSMAKNAGLV